MAEQLAGLQLLLRAPSKKVVDKVLVLTFERRASGLSEDEEAQIAGVLGGASVDEVRKMLVAVRLLERAALKKGVDMEQLAAAIPDVVDARLKALVLKLVSAHLDEWREALVRDREAASAAPHSPSPKAEPQPHPQPQSQPQPQPQAPPPSIPAPAPAQEAAARQPSRTQLQQAPKVVPQQPTGMGPGPSLPRLEGFNWRVDVRSASDTVARMSVPSVLVQMRVQGQQQGKPEPGAPAQPPSKLVTFELNRETLATMLDGLTFVRDQLAAIAK